MLGLWKNCSGSTRHSVPGQVRHCLSIKRQTDAPCTCFEKYEAWKKPSRTTILSDQAITTWHFEHTVSLTLCLSQLLRNTTNGWTYGFIETVVNGERIIGHSGTIGVFNSALVLLPERNIGLFVSYNGAGADRRELKRRIVDHYYPAPPSQTVPQPTTDTKRLAGSYRGTRNNETGWEKWLVLVRRVSVKSTPKGTLRTVGADSGGPAGLFSSREYCDLCSPMVI